MEQRALGMTGIGVSVLGLGTVKLGRNRGVKYPEGFEIPDDDGARRVLDAARAVGMNLLDTAPAYGESEARLGRVLAGQRDEWVIVTKAGERFDSVTGESSFDFSGAGVRESVEQSLRLLGTDRVEAVLIHSDGDDERVLTESGAVEELMRMKEAGQVRAVGASTKTVAGGLLAVEVCDVVMVTVHAGYDDERAVIARAEEKGVGVLVKKALASGHGVSMGTEDALRAVFCGAHGDGISSAVIGSINPDHIRANARAMERVLHG